MSYQCHGRVTHREGANDSDVETDEPGSAVVGPPGGLVRDRGRLVAVARQTVAVVTLFVVPLATLPLGPFGALLGNLRGFRLVLGPVVETDRLLPVVSGRLP